MLLIELGIIVFLHPAIKVFVDVSTIALQLFLLSYTLFPASTIIVWRSRQPLKGEPSIFVTDFGIVTEMRAELSKASSPMYVTELPIITELRAEHPLNAAPPIFFTELGIVIELRLMHPAKAPHSISSTELPMVTEVRLSQL